MNVVDGKLLDPRITQELRSKIEHYPLKKVVGIIVHQTHSYSAERTLEDYMTQSTGAHFLIDRGGGKYTGDDGKIYQTARINKICFHIGKLKSKCAAQQTCKVNVKGVSAIYSAELKKPYPERFPSNSDSIGIELVGRGEGKKDEEVYSEPSNAQTLSAIWLIEQLVEVIPNIGLADIYAHPEVSYKRPTEGAGFWNVVIECELPILGRIIARRSIGNVEVKTQ